MGAITQAKQQAEQQNTQAMTLRDAIKRSEQQFAMALPKHIGVDRFLRASLTALGTVKHLPECTQQSVLAGLMQAAQLGLEVADVRGQAYLIPRKIKGVWTATFQLGYRGMIDLAARAGITVNVGTIHTNDDLIYRLGLNARLEVVPPRLSDRGEIEGYFATATFADGRPEAFRVLDMTGAKEHRDKFASSRDNNGNIIGPWRDHFDAMATKTVIRMLLNYLPISPELRQQLGSVIDVDSTDITDTQLDLGEVMHVPDNVNPNTGEINADATTAIDASATEATS